MALAGAVLATYRGDGDGGGDDGSGTVGTGGQTKAFLPLGEELLRAAGGQARSRLREVIDSGKKLPRQSPSLVSAGGGISGGAEVDGVVGSGSEHSRDGQAAAFEGRKHQQQQNFSTVSTPVSAGDEHDARRRRRGCTVWETPRGMGLTPKTPGARRQSPYTPAADGEEDAGSAVRVDRQSRARGQTVWETPRGVGLTPKTPSAASRAPYSSADGGDDGGATAGGGLEKESEIRYDQDGGAPSVFQQPRARGQTVWETPRGVGLTPKTRGAGWSGPYYSVNGGVEERKKGEDSHGAGSTPALFQPPRARGQTVWETPRGVGLTPKTPGAGSSGRYFSANGGDKRDSIGRSRGVEEQKGGDRYDTGSEPTVYQRPRARGQTVWETPRGMGLTPKTRNVARDTRPSPLSAHEGASPGAWSATSGSLASPVVDGQREMRSYAQGGF